MQNEKLKCNWEPKNCHTNVKLKFLILQFKSRNLHQNKFIKKKKELELEKELLANEIEANNRLKQIQFDQSKVNITPYKSNFLQELESILNERTANVEFALKMKASEEAISDGGISLHEMQILVREATERCKEVGINYVGIYNVCINNN